MKEHSSSTPASDQGVVKLLALEKFNVLKAEYNNLTGAASAVRRTRPNCTSLNVGYTYADGYSANAGVAQGGLVGRVSWSEKGGYHYGFGIGNNQLNAMYTWGGEGDQKTHGWSASVGPVELRQNTLNANYVELKSVISYLEFLNIVRLGRKGILNDGSFVEFGLEKDNFEYNVDFTFNRKPGRWILIHISKLRPEEGRWK
ncbi:hypothetical protein EHQ13_06215 [Leptospira gomenensis]|uniref:Uncharacterized protein n=1 Tax=Leptospira gomenensis TaxID=2484974 RepID=A0A5F1YZY8_9LEPT|nr:hypothetical protein [Leptospira gomenensis]TGK39184.1 hypothetical protein EHQ17_00465 [Leptospira gomenensis]TGK44275.1 hypothetical protein EHQ07_12240 [Leptospira gomenensis]TGK65137.1 hypothetical protein EHQ13_06215 [Leptospira gomenensis]